MRFFEPLFKRLSSAVGVVVGVAIVLWSVPAAAAGFFLPTRGVEATGRAGASIAPHQPDVGAIWHNPAGLTTLDAQQLSLDFAAVGMQVEHRRAPRQMDDGSWREYEPVENQAPPNAIPSILAGGPTGVEGLHWAAGAYTHYAPGARYPVDGPQRYVLVDNIGSGLGYLHAAVGWQINEVVSVGAGLQNFMGHFRIVTVGSGYNGMFGDPEDEDLDMLADTEFTDLFNPTGNVGVNVRPIEQLRVGLSVQLPHVMHDPEATIDARIPDHPIYDNAEITDDRVDVSIPFPFYVRGGVRYVGETFDVEAAVVYQHWSVLDELEITPHEAEVTGVPAVESVPVQPMTVPQGFRNTFSAHLGGAYDLSELFDLRGGYVFERGAVPDERYSVYALDPDKHQLSAGATLQAGGFSFDLTGAAIIMPSKEIDNSEVRQNNPSDPDDEHTIVVGDGSYEHFGYIFGLGTQYRF